MPDLALKQCLDRLCELEPEVFIKDTQKGITYFELWPKKQLLVGTTASLVDMQDQFRVCLESFCDFKSWVW
jgi:hypothetical protein